MSAIAEILTVGHSTREAEELVELLRAHSVAVLADVRRHPGSRRLPWFNAGALEAALGEAGIAYVHLPELGGRRAPAPGSPNGGWKVGQFQGYADHMASAEFAAGLARLTELAAGRRTAVMCAEAQWWRCHRRLVADALVVRGWTVLHAGLRAEPQPHELTDFAVVEDGRITYPPPASAQGRLL